MDSDKAWEKKQKRGIVTHCSNGGKAPRQKQLNSSGVGWPQAMEPRLLTHLPWPHFRTDLPKAIFQCTQPPPKLNLSWAPPGSGTMKGIHRFLQKLCIESTVVLPRDVH